ncbi:MAG: type II toxin-antitoxin system VapC family toxin [Chitinophagaceae bacterium]|nr:type II toxin-antitoxin system VapC family toxin [Chitinophagaceae bacterium]
MSGINSIVADTNIVIYYLEGRPQISPYRFANFYLSVISVIELLGVKTIEGISYRDRKTFIEHSIVLAFDDDIKELTIQIKQQTKIQTSDAIIAATALKYKMPLVTADKNFKKVEGLNLFLLELI